MKKIIFILLARIILLIPVVQAQENKPNDLDLFVKETVQKLNIAGASVLVTQQGKTLLNQGYGFADLSHDVKTTPSTTYFLVGPGGFILSACILQLVEQGKISLDDEVSKYLPEFPLQGRQVKIRHLLNSTSGIIDYHYLGDPLESTYRVPKALDEVIAMFAGKPFTTEAPGSKWDWSISNFALLTAILERITGGSYKDYLQKNLIAPLALKETAYLEEKILIKHFARGYKKQGNEFYPENESLLTYDPSLRISTSTGDLSKIWNGIMNGKIINSKSYALMTTPEGAGKQINPSSPDQQFGYIIRMKKVGDFNAIGLWGALPGFSSHFFYYPQKDLTIVVLSNTSPQYANDIGNAIALKVLGLPPAEEKALTKNSIVNLPVSGDQQTELSGTYTFKLPHDEQRHRSYDFYNRTLRIFVEHGQLEIQMLGDSPEPLLLQEDLKYATYSSPGQRITFDIQKQKASTITFTESGKTVGEAIRVGDADALTFHKTGIPK